jgi:hypothetical protein
MIKDINKNLKRYQGDKQGQLDIGLYTKKYGGQFHFDVGWS